MKEFDRLVTEQMKTMDRLLFLQGELERCQEIEDQLRELQEASKLDDVKQEIKIMKDELREIQQIFESQTEEVIRTYQQISITTG